MVGKHSGISPLTDEAETLFYSLSDVNPLLIKKITIEFIDYKNKFLTDVKMLGRIKNKAFESHTEVE